MPEDPDWQTLRIDARGNESEWMFAFHPLPTPVDLISYEIDVHVVVEGDRVRPTGLFTSQPTTVTDWGTGPEHQMWHFQEPEGPLFVDRTGGDITYEHSTSWTSYLGGANHTGFAFFVAATGKWHADVTINLMDHTGDEVAPQFVSQGDGTILVVDYERRSHVDENGGFVGEILVETEAATPGWTSLQYEYDALYPLGKRDFHARFPDGRIVEGQGTLSGTHVPGVISQYSATNWWDHCGGTAFEGGVFSSRLEYTEMQTRIEAALIHLPMDETDLPEGIRIWYCDMNDPDFFDP